MSSKKDSKGKHDHKKSSHDEKRFDKDNLKQFQYSEPLNMPAGTPFINVLRGEEEVLARLNVCSNDKCDIVWLAATVGWRGNDETNEDLTVEFRIRRGAPDGEIVFATRDGLGVDDGELRGQTTSFIHVDCNRSSCGDDKTEYYLTAELINSPEANDRARIIGPIVFTAAVID